MIIFLVLSAVLAIVCVFLALGYLKRGASLTKLQSAIHRDLEMPLKNGLAVSAQPVASASDAAYDDAFFNKIQKSALDGMNYAALSRKPATPARTRLTTSPPSSRRRRSLRRRTSTRTSSS